jgi:type II secretory pathway pseudopilin PulG
VRRDFACAASGARQRGFLLISAVVLIVIAALILTTMVYLSATSNDSGAGNLQSTQALFVAESGIENLQRGFAQNQSWYLSASDPTPAITRNFGQGSYTVFADLPATLLQQRAQASDTTITVFTTQRFPAYSATPAPPATCNPCYLQLGDQILGGAEYVRYTGISGNTFTGLTRNVTIGGDSGSAGTWPRGTTVYPVTTLITPLPANCNSVNIQIVAHPKFLTAGTVNLEDTEEVSYTGSRLTGGVMTLTGVARCQDTQTGPPGNTPVAHAAGVPVTPVKVGDDSADYQVEVVSTGTVGGTSRIAHRTIQRNL